MAESDWSFLTGSAAGGNIDRGVSSAPSKPNGGGSFVYGFNSITNAVGAVGLYTNLVDFNPLASGGSIRAAIRRGVSGGPTGFSPMLFIGSQGVAISDNAYLLGLEDSDPHHIVLRKGSILDGIGAAEVGTGGVLKKGTDAHLNDTWLHLRLDMIVNSNGDVILQAFENDLDSNAVTAPVWVAIPGVEEFIDDALQINSGSAAYSGGRGGFAFQSADATRRGYFDHVELSRQT